MYVRTHGRDAGRGAEVLANVDGDRGTSQLGFGHSVGVQLARKDMPCIMCVICVAGAGAHVQS